MNYIIEPESAEREKEWREFERTGSIDSYLRYKGVYTSSAEADINSETAAQGGEPIGYY